MQTKVNANGLKGTFKYAYDSENSDIATVSTKGLIKGIAAGDTAVNCIITSGDETIAEIRTNVHVVIPVKKLTPANKSITMAPDTMWRVTVELSPEDATVKDVVWASSKPEVAAVSDNGIIMALQKGKANITATAADGSKIKATIAVTVKNYDLVLKNFRSGKVSYETGTGMFGIGYSAKKGNVEVSGGSGNTVEVTPKQAGEDTVTISIVNYLTRKTKKYSYSVYVEPVISAEENPGFSCGSAFRAEIRGVFFSALRTGPSFGH